MAKGIFIVGTDTDVGKTVITAGIMYILRSNGYNASYFKAALSGALKVNDNLIPGDAKLVREVSDLEEEYEKITPYVYKSPVSPHLAAQLEHKPIDLEVVKEKYHYLKENYDYIVAEGSGGIVCPLIDNNGRLYMIENLIKDLNMCVILVARAGLGTINHTVLTVKYIKDLGIKIKGIIVNNYNEDMLSDDNISMIERLTKVPIIGRFKKVEGLENNLVDNIRLQAEAAFSIDKILACMEQL